MKNTFFYRILTLTIFIRFLHSLFLPMGLLDSFVSFLNEEEKQRFATMPLVGKEKLLRDILVKRSGEPMAKAELMHQLHLSSSHYDKISTLVLKKAYSYLAGDNILEQLNFHSKKFMFRHLFHEIRQLRTKMKTSRWSNEELEKYYRAFFDLSINVPAKYFEEHFVMENASAYLKYVTKDRPTRELEVKAKLLFARLNVLTQGAPDPVSIAKMEREIIDTENRYASVKVPRVKAILYHTWMNFYRMVQPDWEKRTHYLNRIMELYRGEQEVPVFERAVAALHEAEMLYERNQYNDAYVAYTQAFAHFMPLLRNQFHHFARWIELALITEKYDDAKHLLDSLFKVYVLNHHESNGVLGSLLYATLCLLTDNFEHAFYYLSKAKALNSIQVYFNYEMRLRILETLYFAFTKDYEFVARLSQRNMRYIQLQNLSLKKYKYAHFFYLIRDLRKLAADYPDRLPVKLKGYLTEFNEGYDTLFGIMLYKLIKGIKG